MTVKGFSIVTETDKHRQARKRRKARKKAREFSQSLSVRFLAALFSLLSWPLAWLPLSIGLAFGGLVGRLAFTLLSARRKVAVDNIEMVREGGCLDPAIDPVKTARASFINMGRSGWEAIRFYHRGLEPFLPYCSAESGAEYLAEALKEAEDNGRGLMLVTGHIGNWEVMCHYLPWFFNCKLSIVGRSLGSPLANLLVSRMRTDLGNDFIYKKGGAKQMLKVLRHGGVLGTLIDQAAMVNNEGIAAPFLGREAMTNAGPLRLAQRTGVRVIMTLFRREGAHHLMTVLPPLELHDKSEDPEKALREDIVKLNEDLGEYICRYPEQWLWGHKRWKLPRDKHNRRPSA
ncbi:hypothetical protein C4J81_14960 [Deltaproteobacteria bacterium Smac51]|nr:hypothetical protein C4J81_14960 [Deltaproteobacteria bacterium Smac51]